MKHDFQNRLFLRVPDHDQCKRCFRRGHCAMKNEVECLIDAFEHLYFDGYVEKDWFPCAMFIDQDSVVDLDRYISENLP